MHDIILTPPVIFLLFILLGLLFVFGFNSLSAKGSDSLGKGRPYASGQNIEPVRIAPDYSGFFPFAFLFTLLHVVVLIIATLPLNVLPLPLFYLAVAAFAVFVLVRR